MGTNFYSWACQIAYWKVRAVKKFATSKVVFNQEVLDVISQTRSQMEDELDIRHEALSRRLQKLNERDRRMVLTRYESGKNVWPQTSLVEGRFRGLQSLESYSESSFRLCLF